MSPRLMGAALGLGVFLTTSCHAQSTTERSDSNGTTFIGKTLRSLPSAKGGGPPAAQEKLQREELASRLAKVRCEHFRTCGAIGPAGKYADDAACERGEKDRALSAYPADGCAQIDSTAAKACIDSASTPVCSAVADVVYLPLIGRCAPAKLCTH